MCSLDAEQLAAFLLRILDMQFHQDFSNCACEYFPVSISDTTG